MSMESWNPRSTNATSSFLNHARNSFYVLGHDVDEYRGITFFSIGPHDTYYVASGGYDHHWFNEGSVFVKAK